MPGFDDVSGAFSFGQLDSDAPMRAAAFAEVRRLTQFSDTLTSKQMARGFQFAGKRIPFVNPQRGIFKPQQMRHLLSIKTVYPRPGRRVWYEDQRKVHDQIYRGDESVDYAFMGTDPDAADNRWLREAMELQTPIIYFLGTSPGNYQTIVPTFVVGFDPAELKARIAFSATSRTAADESSVERKYALRLVKQRLHQATFREMVIAAYRGKCAISGLPEPMLLDAAHIVDDGDEQFGQPVVSNGLALSKIHHAAFDKHLIGVDADMRVHVSERLLSLHDGPTLESLRQFKGSKLLLPDRSEDSPDRDRLARRFERFRTAA